MPNLVTKLTIAALLAGASLPGLAAPGNGIRLGGSEGRLHPFVELEGRYDSNVYTDTASGAVDVGDLIIHVRPGLTLSVPGEMTSVDLSAKLDWAQYLGNQETATKDLSKLYAEAELGIGLNKKGAVAFELNDFFRRSDRPEALTLNTGLISNYNLLDVRVPWRPGGGALTLNVNGAWSMETYENLFGGYYCDPALNPLCTASSVSDLNYNQVGAGAGAAWKFLPRTAAILDGNYFSRIPADATSSPTGDSTGYNVSAGLKGLVTPHVAATLKAGYGSVDSSSAAFGTQGSWLGTVECEWLPTEAAAVKLGYVHNITLDPVAVYTTNRVSLSARQLVAGRFALGLTASYDGLDYSPGTTSILQVSPSLGVEVTRWFTAEVAYAYTDRSSADGAPNVGADYTKNEAWLKLVATY